MKKSMEVEGYKITAWKGKDGLMRLEVEAADGREFVTGLNHSWEQDGRIMFTDNSTIIECLTDSSRSDDCRESPGRLHKWGQDPMFHSWFAGSNDYGTRGPDEWASSIERTRRREGRDIETGALMAPNKEAVAA